MKLKSIKKLIGALAPTIGTAIGGPVGGLAANVVAEALGVEPVPKKIEKAIQQATPEQLLKLKTAEKEFEKQMKQMDIDVYALSTADIQDARNKFSADWTPRFLCTLTLGGFIGYIFLVTIYPIEDTSDDIVMLILGYMSGIASAVVSFYFGSSNKDK